MYIHIYIYLYIYIYIYMYLHIYTYILKWGYETCWRKRRAMRTPKSSPGAGPYTHSMLT